MSQTLELNPKTLLDDPTAGYHPRPLGFFPGWTWFRREHFSAMHVEAMLCDPQVCLGYSMLTAPIYIGEYEVEAKRPEVKKWVEEQLDTLKQSFRILLRYMAWGYGAYQIVDDVENGYLVVDGVKDFHPLDSRPLRSKSSKQVWGVRVHGVEDEPHGVDLEFGKGLWLANDPHYGMLHGLSAMNGAFWPWLEKVGKDGGEDIRRLWFYKNAFRGEVVRFPQINLKTEAGVVREAKDIAIEMTAMLKTGGIVALPNAVNKETGKYEWEIEFAKMNDTGKGLLDYCDHLDLRIFRGMGLPDDVVSQPDGGGGTYGGRRIGWEAFLTIRQQDWVYLLKILEKQVLRPRAQLNFNHAEFKIKAKSLLESQSADVRGQQGQPGAAPPGPDGAPSPGVPTGTPNPFGGGQLQMSFDGGAQFGHAPKGGKTVKGKQYKGGQFTPLEGHPLGELDAQQAAAQLAPMGDAGRQHDPRPWRGVPRPENAADVAKDLHAAIGAQKRTNAFARLSIEDAHKSLLAKHPALTIAELHGVIQDEHDAGRLRAAPYTQSPASHPNPHYLLPLDRELKGYLDQGSVRMGWTESEHPRGQPDNAGEFASADHVQGWLAKAAEVPAHVMAKVRDKVQAKYESLEERYGRAQAIAIIGAGIATLPVPGGTLITAAMVGMAELYHQLKGADRAA